MKLKLIAIAAGLGLAICGSAHASVSYSYSADSSAYTGATGNQVSVNLYLNETLTGSSTSYINNAGGGLTNAGAAVNVVSATGGSAAQIPASAANSTTTFVPAAAFGGPTSEYYDQGTTSASQNNLEFTEGVVSSANAIQTTNNKILLGTLHITVGTGTTTFTVTTLNNDTINGSNSALGQSNFNTTTLDPTPLGSDLDVSSANYTGANDEPAFNFTVSPTPTPEPASLALLGLLGGGLLMGRRRARTV